MHAQTSDQIIVQVSPPKRPAMIDATAQIKRHQKIRQIINFISLAVGLGGAASLFFWFWPNRNMLRFATLLLASFYIIWGTLTHTKNKNLSVRVFWEYFSIGTFGALMLWLVI